MGTVRAVAAEAELRLRSGSVRVGGLGASGDGSCECARGCFVCCGNRWERGRRLRAAGRGALRVGRVFRWLSGWWRAGGRSRFEAVLCVVVAGGTRGGGVLAHRGVFVRPGRGRAEHPVADLAQLERRGVAAGRAVEERFELVAAEAVLGRARHSARRRSGSTCCLRSRVSAPRPAPRRTPRSNDPGRAPQTRRGSRLVRETDHAGLPAGSLVTVCCCWMTRRGCRVLGRRGAVVGRRRAVPALTLRGFVRSGLWCRAGLTERRTVFSAPERVMAWAEAHTQGAVATRVRLLAARFAASEGWSGSGAWVSRSRVSAVT